jgi:CheY-like chemotaxis protein
MATSPSQCATRSSWRQSRLSWSEHDAKAEIGFFAADSTSAVSEARKQQPDLIILDLGLPAGDGFIVLERFRANMNLAVIPVIVVSARDLHGNKERALKAGAKAFVQKPWNDSELLTLISEELGLPNIVYLSTAKHPYPEDT